MAAESRWLAPLAWVQGAWQRDVLLVARRTNPRGTLVAALVQVFRQLSLPLHRH